MTAGARHIAWKDLRQHGPWVAAYLAVVIVRAALIGSGIDAATRDPNVIGSLGVAYVALTVLQFALLVTVAVQLVQGDRVVGTTAFWLTRPVARGSLMASKLSLAFALLVVVPVVLDGFVILANGLAWMDALGAVAEGVAVRLAVTLPIMALASVTADLAMFVVSAIATFVSTLALQATLQWLKVMSWKSNDLVESLTAVVIVSVVAGSLTALAHQYYTRRTPRTVVMIALTIALGLTAANRLERPFLGVPRSLEPGWLDPSRVSVTFAPLPALRLEGALHAERPWELRADYTVAGSPANVVLAPFGLDIAVTLRDGRTTLTPARLQLGREVPGIGAKRDQQHLVERLLGHVELLDAPPPQKDPRVVRIARLTAEDYLAYSQGRARLDAMVTLGSKAYQACRPLPLRADARSRCGDRQVVVLSAEYRDGQCLVALRDVTAGFAIDLRRRSSVIYILVNRGVGKALMLGVRDYSSSRPVFGPGIFVLLGEHLVVTHRNLVFEAPKDMPALGPDWLTTAEVVPLEVRDIGEFTVKAQIQERRSRD